MPCKGRVCETEFNSGRSPTSSSSCRGLRDSRKNGPFFGTDARWLAWLVVASRRASVLPEAVTFFLPVAARQVAGRRTVAAVGPIWGNGIRHALRPSDAWLAQAVEHDERTGQPQQLVTAFWYPLGFTIAAIIRLAEPRTVQPARARSFSSGPRIAYRSADGLGCG